MNHRVVVQLHLHSILLQLNTRWKIHRKDITARTTSCIPSSACTKHSRLRGAPPDLPPRRLIAIVSAVLSPLAFAQCCLRARSAWLALSDFCCWLLCPFLRPQKKRRTRAMSSRSAKQLARAAAISAAFCVYGAQYCGGVGLIIPIAFGLRKNP